MCQNIEGFKLLVDKVSFFFLAFSTVMRYSWCDVNCMFVRVYKEGNYTDLQSQ